MESYDLILTSLLYAQPGFKKQFGEQLADGSWSLSSKWQLALSVIASAGLAIGLLISGWICDKWRPRYMMIICHILIAGFIFVPFYATTIEMVFGGIFLISIPCGVFASATPNYAAEICPVKLRSYVTTYINLCWVAGHLICAGVVAGTLDIDGMWSYRVPFAVQWSWPLFMIIICWFAPESPWWLTRKGQESEARISLDRVCSAPEDVIDPEHTMAVIQETLRLEKEAMRIQGGYLDCFKGANLRRTEIAVVSWGGQVLPGFVLQNYCAYFFTLAGLPSNKSFYMSCAQQFTGTYGVAFIGTIFSMILLSRFGRRQIYITGLFTMLPLMWIIGFLDLRADSNTRRWAQAGLLLAWFFLYSSSIGPIPYAIGSEVGAARLRSKTISLARAMYYVLSILNSVVAPYMLNPANGNLGGKAAFLPASLNIFVAIWAWFRLPETKDLGPGILDLLFEARTPTRLFVEESKKFM
ncbi:general substrate transporter [Penicillium angulare]|uniref:general substrate transporter n=1 Tax=Penicillium angulare TaxID=116970 RepID=UPI0025406655|nr:general substrate transporter [Penicillium angulare]KAJ5279729.1 general substrate transporter [Penicillium angulare]